MSRPHNRPRKHIAIRELCAAALSLLLPPAERDALRAAKVPAKQIISLFTPDHVILHAFGGPDRWWNITMTRRGPALKAKDSRDTAIVAKVDRVAAAHREFVRKVLRPTRRRRRRQTRWPQGRKLQSRSSFERRRHA